MDFSRVGLRAAMLGMTAALAMPTVAAPAAAGEQVITLENEGQRVMATLETPDSGGPAPVVLLLHGFTGTRDELPIQDTDEGVFSRTARVLAEAGYASLRIDFRGSGESGGMWEDTTFSGQVSDAVMAIDHLAGHPEVDGSRIAILGWSQGGLVGALAAQARPDVKAVILWAPVVEPRRTFGDLFGDDFIESALVAAPDEVMTAALPWGVDTKLRAAFFREFATTSPGDAIADYPGPLLVIAGSNDTVVAPQPETSQILIDYHEGAEDLVIFETDHVWDAFSGPAMLDENMIPTTIAWLAQHL